MDDGTSWTPGEPPEPVQPPQPTPATWSAPAPPVPPRYGATPPGYGTVPAGYGAVPPGYGTVPPGYGAIPPGYGYGAPPPYGVPASPTDPGTDGFAIAALIFGILGGWLSFVFGAIALSRIRRSGARGRGMAIAGMVTGAAIILLEIGAAVAIPVLLNQRHVALHSQCANGDMAACDTLYTTSAEGSTEQEFGNTCGGRTPGGYLCTSMGKVTHGDDPHLDTLWDAWSGGDGAACDELSWSAQPGTDYAQFGQTCGGRTDGTVACVDALDPSSTT